MSDRLEALRSSPRKYSSPPRPMYRSRNYQPYTPPPQQQNNRLDFLKERAAPRKSAPQRNIVEERKKVVPRVLNDRFQYLKVSEKKEPAKKGFVAMPSKHQWEEGWRPGWILRENKAPPEKYEEAIQIYKNYVQTGELVFPDNKFKGDKAKQIATQYMMKGKKNKK